MGNAARTLSGPPVQKPNYGSRGRSKFPRLPSLDPLRRLPLNRSARAIRGQGDCDTASYTDQRPRHSQIIFPSSLLQASLLQS